MLTNIFVTEGPTQKTQGANMKIAFVWFFDKAETVFDNWRDGLRAAMEHIGRTHHVEWVIGKKYPEDKYDAIVFWDDSNSDFFKQIHQYHGKKALCLTTDPRNFDNLRTLDVVYCESGPVYEAVRAQGIQAIKAFGTDTDFFTPDKNIEKDIAYFYPATFSPWKRQSEIAYLGKQLTCVGTIQPDGLKEYEDCLRSGVNIEVGYFPVAKIRDYYRRAKRVIIPAVHGSERTVLEAMACGIWPEVVSEVNIRTRSYIQELEKSGLSPREFVIKNYSHTKYAEQIMKGILP